MTELFRVILMTRSPASQIPSGAGQPATGKRDEEAFNCRQDGEANLRAATQVNVVSASLIPPAIKPIQLELISGRAYPLEAKSATIRNTARMEPSRRGGVEDSSTQRKLIQLTGEARCGPADENSAGREAYKGQTRKCSNEAEPGDVRGVPARRGSPLSMRVVFDWRLSICAASAGSFRHFS
jgi:hypothetical protein